MCAAPKFDTWTHEKLARAKEHPSNHVERRTHVSPSSRRLSQFAPRRRRLQLPQILIGGLLGQSRGTVERLHRHGHVQAEQLQMLVPVEVHREFETAGHHVA